MPASPNKRRTATVLLQVKVERRAATELRKRAKSAMRSQASYLRMLIYRDLGLIPSARATDPRDQGT